MNSVYLTFGINAEGQWQSISEVPSGQTDLRCPWCKRALIAKKGDINTHHFSHNGQTCRISQDASVQTQLPTFDTFELLDKHEAQYLERRAKYGSHRKVYSWTGMDEAVDRLEMMGILSVERTTEPKLDDVRAGLKRLNNHWLDSSGRPTKALLELFKALEPIADLEYQWSRCIQVESTKIDRNYSKNQFDNLKTLSDLDRAQRYWFDAFWRRQSLIEPDYLEFMKQKFHALNRQNLYVMRITGEFCELPSTFIKVGLSARHADLRLQEVISSLKSFGKSIKGEVLAVKECAGRLERLLHRLLSTDNLEIGTFTEFFTVDQLDWLLSQMDEVSVAEYMPPEITSGPSDTPLRTGGRSKKTDAELLAEYEHVAALIRAGKGIRETSRIAGCSVNTVQKVKAASLKVNSLSSFT